jgi:hypothetical protein
VDVSNLFIGGDLMKSVSPMVAAAVVVLSTAAWADDPSCDLKVGGSVGAYKVVKVGGIDDGVEAGKALCYM